MRKCSLLKFNNLPRKKKDLSVLLTSGILINLSIQR